MTKYTPLEMLDRKHFTKVPQSGKQNGDAKSTHESKIAKKIALTEAKELWKRIQERQGVISFELLLLEYCLKTLTDCDRAVLMLSHFETLLRFIYYNVFGYF